MSNVFGSSNPSGGTNPTGALFGSSSSNATTPLATNTQPSLFTNKPATGGNLFGNTTTAGTNNMFGSNVSATTPLSGGLFSGSSSNTAPGGGLFGPSSQNTVFGQQSTPASTTSGTSLASGTNLFGLPPKPADAGSTTIQNTGATATASSTGGSLFSGGLFGGKGPAAGTTNPAPSASSALGGSKDTSASTTGNLFSLGGNKDSIAPAASTSGLFGGIGSATKPAEKKDTSTTTTPGLNLFGAAKTDDKKDSSAVGSSLAPPAKESEKPQDSKEPSTTANVVAVPPPSMLRGKSLEEIINRWNSELETHVKEFSKFAGEVAVWDRALIENGNNLAALYSHVLAAERQQNEIDQSLDHIEQQQKDLSSTLDTYEKVSNEILGGQGGGLRALDTGPADTERDKNYMLAADLHTQLDDLSGSLTQMIESVNGLSLTSKPNDTNGDDPMTQIAQILSSHLESLQWIDVAVREVEGKVVEVEKRVKESGHTIPNGSSIKPRAFGNNR
ncbi:Nsp1-like C-terminal region-domain-containing protein [Cyathus striatus]|nr:Nsp1-like C-terminal region-domain-containing protein [Cyathus striatus]